MAWPSGESPRGIGATCSSSSPAQPTPLGSTPLGDPGPPYWRRPRLHPARCDPAAGHLPSRGPGARPRLGRTAAVSSSGSSSGSGARAAPGGPRPETPMKGAAAADRGGGARASVTEVPGGVCGRPARCALTPLARPRPAPEPRPHFHTVLPGRGWAAQGQCRPSRPPPFLFPAPGCRGRGRGGPRVAVSLAGATLCPLRRPGSKPVAPAWLQPSGSLALRLFTVSYNLTQSLF